MMVERRATGEPGYRYPYAASALTVASIGLLLVFPYLIMQQQDVLHHPVAILAEAMVILMFASVLLGSPILKPILRFRLLAFLGEISYSLFLLHTTILIAMVAFIGPSLRAWVGDQGGPAVWATFVTFAFVALAVSGALSYLSYRYIESPFLRHKPK
jgi:peptidoglycan/LPS O-acetylase OafA/YrhL